MQHINVHNLKHSLDCLCDCLNTLYGINNGGCCYVAYLIARHLDKLKVKYNLVVYDDSLKRNEELVKYEILHKKSPNSVTGSYTCSHYCISIIGGGIVNDDSYEYKLVVGNVKSSHIKWLYIHGAWNKMYDTDNNKIVKNMIKSFFSKYEKNNLSNY